MSNTTTTAAAASSTATTVEEAKRLTTEEVARFGVSGCAKLMYTKTVVVSHIQIKARDQQHQGDVRAEDVCHARVRAIECLEVQRVINAVREHVTTPLGCDEPLQMTMYSPVCELSVSVFLNHKLCYKHLYGDPDRLWTASVDVYVTHYPSVAAASGADNENRLRQQGHKWPAQLTDNPGVVVELPQGMWVTDGVYCGAYDGSVTLFGEWNVPPHRDVDDGHAVDVRVVPSDAPVNLHPMPDARSSMRNVARSDPDDADAPPWMFVSTLYDGKLRIVCFDRVTGDRVESTPEEPVVSDLRLDLWPSYGDGKDMVVSYARREIYVCGAPRIDSPVSYIYVYDMQTGALKTSYKDPGVCSALMGEHDGHLYLLDNDRCKYILFKIDSRHGEVVDSLASSDESLVFSPSCCSMNGDHMLLCDRVVRLSDMKVVSRPYSDDGYDLLSSMDLPWCCLYAPDIIVRSRGTLLELIYHHSTSKCDTWTVDLGRAFDGIGGCVDLCDILDGLLYMATSDRDTSHCLRIFSVRTREQIATLLSELVIRHIALVH